MKNRTKTKSNTVGDRRTFTNAQGLDHKVNGPASIWDDNDWFWYLNGKAHRYYGPSNVMGDWNLHGREIKTLW